MLFDLACGAGYGMEEQLATQQATHPENETLSEPLGRLDLHDGLAAAGFTKIHVLERPDWLEQEIAMWKEAAGLDPGDDPALRSLRDEALDVLATTGEGRVIASATA